MTSIIQAARPEHRKYDATEDKKKLVDAAKSLESKLDEKVNSGTPNKFIA